MEGKRGVYGGGENKKMEKQEMIMKKENQVEKVKNDNERKGGIW